MSTKPLHLKLEGICQSFGEKQVLTDISFDHEVTALAIIGPSGGGKSTLLRILGGLLVPNAGRLVVDGNEVEFSETGLLKYRKRLGFVFQDGGLFHHLTALENLTVPLKAVHGFSENEAIKRANELFERLGVQGVCGQYPAQLSGGQKQRVSIARALAASPELLLLDEPTSALDPEYTNEVLDVINDLREGGTRFIIVTHEMGFARHACDDVAFLYDGELLEYGTSSNVFEHPQTPELKRFLGRLLEWRM